MVASVWMVSSSILFWAYGGLLLSYMTVRTPDKRCNTRDEVANAVLNGDVVPMVMKGTPFSDYVNVILFK